MKRWFFLALICFAMIGVLLWRKKTAPPHIAETPVAVPEDLEFYRSIKPGCPSEFRPMTMEEPYLKGLLEVGDKFQAAMNFYQCNPPERGDLVLYRYSHKMLPVARQLVAVGGDKFTMRKTKTGWELSINGKTQRAGNKNFVFGVPEAEPPLALYAKANGGKLLPNHVIVLSTIPPGDKDSTVFGAVDVVDIIAKISHSSLSN